MNRQITLALCFVFGTLLGVTAFVASPIASRGGSVLETAQAYTMTDASYTTTEDGRRVSDAGYDITPLPSAQIDRLAENLTEEQAKIILKKGTEQAFCGNLLDNKKDGTYVCRLCKLPLFSSESKFKSGTGWPSFFQPVDEAHVHTERDTTLGMVREEILCARCDGHLGHVFEDGPKPTGLRFCVNSASLEFVDASAPMPEQATAPVASNESEYEKAYFAGGCFWGVEDRFQQVPGVVDAVSGYMGGHVPDPTYKQVCFTDSGHAEAVEVTYDPSQVTYDDLLEWFFKFHDPTQVNRQGPDVGPQYRSAIFPANDEQREKAQAFIAEVDATDRFKRKIATNVEPTATFYKAEAYHQDYHKKHGGSCALPDFE